MSVYRRNGMAASEENDGLVLKHHWNAKDDLVNNRWMDRVTGTAYFTINPEWKEAAGIHMMPRQASALCMDGPMDLGRHFKIEIDVRAEAVPMAGYPTIWVVPIDFQSIGGLNLGFGLLVSEQMQWLSINFRPYRSINFKKGAFTVPQGEPMDGVFTLEYYPVDETRNIWRVQFGDIELFTEPYAFHPMNGIAPERITLNRGATCMTWSNENYTHDILYRSIKIYTAL